MRARDLGITIGRGTPGPRQRHHRRRRASPSATRPSSAARVPLVRGQGPVRTGVTVILPARRRGLARAGLRGLPPAQRQRRADRPRVGPRIGPAHDADRHHQHAQRRRRARRARRGLGRGATRSDPAWSLPVVGRDVRRPAQRHQRLPRDRPSTCTRRWPPRPTARSRKARSVAGPGMICHEFKGGIGTASRVLDADVGGLHGRRPGAGQLRQARRGCASMASGSARPSRSTEVPSPYGDRPAARHAPPTGSGSIIVVVATDAPLLPHQCERLAQRAGLGIARVGGTGGHTSGDLFIAFATGNRLPRRGRRRRRPVRTRHLHGPGGRRHRHRPRCSTRSSRRPRRRSSTPWSRPRP